MRLPPIFYHFFDVPLPYVRTLALQNHIHELQLAQRRATGKHNDYLLLLEHRPVYTAGRRQTEAETKDEATRLARVGADFVRTQRGGELTYHGPGQLVGYPLLDLGRHTPAMSIREYICRLQSALKLHLHEAHALKSAPSEHTGVFLDAHTKIASIGVQVRHRLTTHGFALNVTHEPCAWFDLVVACGLADVRAGSIAGRGRAARDAVGKVGLDVKSQVPGIVEVFGRTMERDMIPVDPSETDEVTKAIAKFEQEARMIERENPALHAPSLTSTS